MLQRGDERQLDALASLIGRRGPGKAVLEPEQLVRIWLEPHRLDDRFAGRDVGIAGRSVIDWQHALGSPPDRVQANVRGDRVQPGAQRASALEAGDAPPCAQQHLLHGVLRVVHRAQHAVAVGVQLGAVGLEQPAEGILPALPGALEQSLLAGAPGSGLSARHGQPA